MHLLFSIEATSFYRPTPSWAEGQHRCITFTAKEVKNLYCFISNVCVVKREGKKGRELVKDS